MPKLNFELKKLKTKQEADQLQEPLLDDPPQPIHSIVWPICVCFCLTEVGYLVVQTLELVTFGGNSYAWLTLENLFVLLHRQALFMYTYSSSWSFIATFVLLCMRVIVPCSGCDTPAQYSDMHCSKLSEFFIATFRKRWSQYHQNIAIKDCEQFWAVNFRILSWCNCIVFSFFFVT